MYLLISYIKKRFQMTSRLLYFLIALTCWISFPLSGQISMSQWRTHLPYQYCFLAETTNDRVYCSTTGGLFYYKLDDHLVEKISKVDGLSDNGVSAMRWSGEQETLILAYESSNLDIIRQGSVVNLPDIMKKQISGDKSIYDISLGHCGERLTRSMDHFHRIDNKYGFK